MKIRQGISQYDFARTEHGQILEIEYDLPIRVFGGPHVTAVRRLLVELEPSKEDEKFWNDYLGAGRPIRVTIDALEPMYLEFMPQSPSG